MPGDVFGLGDDAEQVYRAVVEAASATAAELAEATRLEGPRLDRALERLTEAGLVLRVPGAPDRYEPAAAAVTWKTWLAGVEATVAQRLAAAGEVAEALARLPGTSGGGVTAGVIELVEGRGEILRRVDQLQRTARTQVRIIDKPPYATAAAKDTLDRERELLTRGVAVRVVYTAAGLASLHDLREDVQPSISAGEQARVTADAPLKMALFDDTAAIVPVESDPGEMSRSLVIHRSALLDGLGALFEHQWTLALPLHLPETVEGAEDGGPSLEDLQLLGLLTAGLTDAVIARHLRVGLRTVQRRLQAIMDRLGAQTRFQASLYAVRAGWITADTNAPAGPAEPDQLGSADAADKPEHPPGLEGHIADLTTRLADAEASRAASESALGEARRRAAEAETALRHYRAEPGGNDQP